VGFAMGVPFCNASIKWNTLGTYQLLKALMTPLSLWIQIVWYRKTFTTQVKLSLIPICIGVAITGIADFEINGWGLISGVGCVVISVLTQIWSQNKQQELDLNSMQLMYYTTPLSVGVLLLTLPAVDDLFTLETGLLYFTWSPFVIFLLVITGIFACVINITIYFILKETSPITYQIFGHAKTCTILLGSFVLFAQPLTNTYVFGMAITMGGAFAYTYVKLKGY